MGRAVNPVLMLALGITGEPRQGCGYRSQPGQIHIKPSWEAQKARDEQPQQRIGQEN